MKGIFSALMVAFDEHGQIDENGLREIIRFNIDVQNVDGLYVGGSTGENFMLSTEEKKQIFKITKDEAKDQVTLIAQIGSINLQEAVELGQYATSLGYDAVSAVTPFYYKFDFEEVKDYYQTIASEVDNKLVIYTIPMLTGVNMTIEQFSELFAIKNVVGVKFTAADLFLLERIRYQFPDKIIYAGFDELLLSSVSLGVDGAIGSTYNINCKRAKEIFSLVNKGQVAQAREIQHQCNDIISGLLKESFFQSLKTMLHIQGANAGICKKPFKAISESRVNQLKQLNAKYF
ncbi:N-acetylneuraminate lyase [Francisella sp. LA112445]|uniref:N-acetylneuraminate lyase n=1 Tax=Francisella sp. LA112445 TaxID=1395624 RepID=UPI001788AE5D|nr:N-acetylneuraminate lyase [Francisella sp. LA112445]QIW10008.1 N-acetylneuraminate lyase [Francisella sp. LA112445]